MNVTVADSPGAIAAAPLYHKRQAVAKEQGWGPDGIHVMLLDAVPARSAATEHAELDGMVIEAAIGYELKEQNTVRNILLFGDMEKSFYTHVTFAPTR